MDHFHNWRIIINSFESIKISLTNLILKFGYSKEFSLWNEVSKTNLNAYKRILNWQPFMKVVYCTAVVGEIAPVSRRSWVPIPLKAWFFQASSFQLLKLENLLRWSFLTFIFNTPCSPPVYRTYLHIIYMQLLQKCRSWSLASKARDHWLTMHAFTLQNLKSYFIEEVVRFSYA